MDRKISNESQNSSPSKNAPSGTGDQHLMESLLADVENCGAVRGISNPCFEMGEKSNKKSEESDENSSKVANMIENQPIPQICKVEKKPKIISSLRKAGAKWNRVIGGKSSYGDSLQSPFVGRSDMDGNTETPPTESQGGASETPRDPNSLYSEDDSLNHSEYKRRKVEEAGNEDGPRFSMETSATDNAVNEDAPSFGLESSATDDAVNEDGPSLGMETSAILEEFQRIEDKIDSPESDRRTLLSDDNRRKELEEMMNLNAKKLEEIRDSTDNVQ